MENFDIEAMKKKYSEESPEEKEKRTKMEMLPAVINICVGIAMVVVGAMNVMTIRTLLIFSKWVLT